MSEAVWHGTTILSVRKGGQVVIAGDGQVSLGNTVIKANAKKVRRIGKGRIRAAIIGVGNCASSLVQGVHYYRTAKPGDRIPGIMHVDLGGYHIRDVDFVAAFDVDRNKVGKDLAEAIKHLNVKTAAEVAAEGGGS